LTFSTAVYEGSVNADHYYVKVSTDGGTTWDEVWDASTLTGNAWNYYAYPYTIDLSAYTGQSVKVAFNAVDGPTNDGLWYIWFIDDITIGSKDGKYTFTADEIEHISNGVKVNYNSTMSIARDGNTAAIEGVSYDKSLVQYLVYLDDMVTPVGYTSETSYEFAALVGGQTYTAGVVAEYTTGSSEMSTLQFTVPLFLEVTVNVTTNAGSAEGAYVELSQGDLVFSATVGSTGSLVFEGIDAGTYDLSVSLVDFEDYSDEIVVAADMTVDVELVEIIDAPFNLEIYPSETENTAVFTWNNVYGDLEFEDNFEGGDLSSWELIEGSGTIGETGYPYWYASDVLFFEGAYGAVVDWGFDIDTWIITPGLAMESDFYVSFAWNSSYYWSVDPNDNSDLFVQISTDDGATWTSIWTYGDIGVWDNFVWYETTLSLADYAGQTVKVAFNIVGNDNAQNGLDNVYIGNGTKAAGTRSLMQTSLVQADVKKAPVESIVSKSFQNYNIYLDDMVTPVGTVTGLTHTFTDLAWETSFTAGVSSAYTSGESAIQTIPFQTVVGIDEVTLENEFTVYPNPANSKLFIGSDYRIDKVELYNTIGKLIVTENDYVNEINVEDLIEGIYIMHITSGNNVITKRVSITR